MTDEITDEKNFVEIKMSSGWFMTISLQKSDKFEEQKEYVEIAKERSGQKGDGSTSIPSMYGLLGKRLLSSLMIISSEKV